VDDGCGVELDCGACLGPSGGTSTSSGFTTTTTSTTDTGDTPCTAVEAIFFDLGETLVTETSPLFFEDIPGATTLLAELKADGIRLGIITNTLTGWDEPYLASLLDNPALLDAFEVVLLSSQASAGSKPDPAIFAEAHSMLVDPPPIGQTAFVSEELEDIANRETDPTEGARAAGMVGVHLSAGAASALADHTHPPTDLASLAEAAWLSCD
jgi:FMN phosphatase YigB (HAD superfamily)